MNPFLKAFLILPALCLSATAAESVYWVANGGSDSNDGSFDHPFHTIQKGINVAAAGDTVKVKPGNYTKTDLTDASGHHVAVYLDKDVTVEASGSRDETFITGAYDPTAGQNGMGSAAIRCVSVKSGCTGAVLKGFTLRNGAGGYSNGASGYAGGVYFEGASDKTRFTAALNPCIVDCVITNCVGTRGAGAHGGNLIRCRIDDCRAYKAGGNLGGSAARYANLYHTLVVNCSQVYTIDYSGTLVNCTFVSNTYSDSLIHEASRALEVRNSVFVGNSGGVFKPVNSGTITVRDSVLQVAQANFAATDGGGNVFGVEAPFAIAGTAFGLDARPCAVSVAGTDGFAVGRGTADGLALIPEAYRYVDAAGTDFSGATSCQAGAFQTVASNPGGAFQMPTTAGGTIDGVAAAAGTFFHPEVYPTQLCVQITLPAGKKFFGCVVNGSAYWTFPTVDDKFYVMPVPGTNRTTLTVSQASTVLYAAPDGSDDNDGLSAATPKTLQGAADASATCGLVIAAAGDYTSGVRTASSLAARLVFPSDRQLRIVGSGNKASVIYGAPDPDTVDGDWKGCGPNATRCVCMANKVACLQNFTLREGYASRQTDGGGGTDSNCFAGGVMMSRDDQFLIDCDFYGCQARAAAPFLRGVAIRCGIFSCSDYNNSLTQNSKLFGCVFSGNHATYGLVGTEVQAYNCTVDCNKQQFGTGTGLYRNLIFRNGVGSKTGEFIHGGIVGCLFESPAVCNYEGSYTNLTDAGLVDGAGGDWRLRSVSPAVGYGTVTNDLARYASCDRAGNRLQFVNGKPVCGAFFAPVPYVRVGNADGTTEGLTVTGGAYGENALSAETPLVVSVGTTRKFDHFIVDGRDLPSTQTSLTFTYPASGTQLGGDVKAVWATDYYVNPDPAIGDDANDGFTPETPKRTLAGVFAKRWAGDVVHAAEGDYDELTMLQRGTYCATGVDPTIRARVVVPDGVTLVATGDRARTRIIGAAATNPDKYGNGVDAVRCLVLGRHSAVKGFTITDGRVKDSTTREANDNFNGGGVLTYPVTDAAGCGLVENCVITNCVGIRGGAGCGGEYRNCRIVGNKAVVYVPGVRLANLYGCFIDFNRGENTLQDCYLVASCTLGSDNKKLDGASSTKPYVPGGALKPNAVNSIILSPEYNAGVWAQNCLFLDATQVRLYVAQMTNCQILATADLKIGSDGRPAIDSPAVDAADADYLYAEKLGGVDVDGGQRVYNGRQDIGAFEYDWRPHYASLLLKRATVTYASPDAVAVGNAVCLSNGVLRLTRNLDREVPVQTSVEVLGGGSLGVQVGEASFGPYVAGAAQTIERTVGAGALEIVYSYASDGTPGCARLDPVQVRGGMVILVR